MHVQLSLSEVQEAVAEYLRKRGAIVTAPERIQVEIRNNTDARIDLVGARGVVIAYEVELPVPEGPYR